jgi:cytochrome c oxidase cbb3-type subunit III
LRAVSRRGRRRSAGYPNLNDDDWIWGGTLAGDRADHPIRRALGRMTRRVPRPLMPAFGRDGMLNNAQINDVADFVRVGAKLPALPMPIARSARRFSLESCAACHGTTAAATANWRLNLVDAIWLYGSDRASIIEGIRNGRGAMMPAGRGASTTSRSSSSRSTSIRWAAASSAESGNAMAMAEREREGAKRRSFRRS